MEYLESEKIKEKPELYVGIKESLSWILKEPFIFDYFNKFIKKDSKILEIGCGRGYFLDKLDKAGFQNLYGADLANYLENKKYKHQSLDLNIEKLNFKNDELDVITAFQVVEHLENYFLIAQEASRTLKKDGMFIFSIPNQFNIFYRIKFALTGSMSGWTPDNNHLLFTTRDVFKKTYLKDFDLVKTHYNRGPMPMLGRLNFLPWVNFPAKNRILPRCEAFSDRVCFLLKKK